MEMQERINNYWSKRADEFGDARYMDMQGRKRENWTNLIRQHLPVKKPIRALDLGTGAGFFAFILHDLGCQVTGIDYSEKMLQNAYKNCERLGYSGIRFHQMDAQDLQFDDESFDFIFTRNVTWTLPDPAKAYREMYRVLAAGGKLMNADANYSAGFKKMDSAGLKVKAAVEPAVHYQHPAASPEMIRERNDIAQSLYIADEKRPAWDINILSDCGFSRFWIDMDVNRNVFRLDRNLLLSVSPEFVLTAEKII